MLQFGTQHLVVMSVSFRTRCQPDGWAVHASFEGRGEEVDSGNHLCGVVSVRWCNNGAHFGPPEFGTAGIIGTPSRLDSVGWVAALDTQRVLVSGISRDWSRLGGHIGLPVLKRPRSGERDQRRGQRAAQRITT